MSARKEKPQAARQRICPGRGDGGLLSSSLTSSYGIIVPQNRGNCQVINVRQLALPDDVLGRYNAARARYLAGGDHQDYRTMQALADDRRALLAQTGGGSWP